MSVCVYTFSVSPFPACPTIRLVAIAFAPAVSILLMNEKLEKILLEKETERQNVRIHEESNGQLSFA